MTRTRYLDWLARDLEATAAPERRHQGLTADLVIGYATGYGPHALSPFVRSLRAHSDARCALVASPSAPVRDFLDAHQIDRFDAPSNAGWAPHLLIARFKCYLSILNAYPDARRALIVDVRDLAFQADPFASGFGDEAASIVLYAESEPGRFDAQGANRRWVDMLIGAGLGARMGDAPVVCGGTIMGEPENLKRLIRTLLSLCAIQKSGLLEGIGADQAALNVIAHWGLLEVMVAPNYRRTATIGHAAPLSIAADQLLNADGSISPIIHQYDRHAAANELILKRFGAPDAAPPKPKRKSSRWRRSFAKRWPEWR
jgi:hypothetical protein